MSIFLITLFSFLAATSLIVVIVLLVTAVQTSPQARIRKRLTAIGRNPYASQAEVQSLLKGTLYSDLPWLNDLLTRLNFVRGLSILLERANVDISVGLFLLISLFSGGIILFVLGVLGQPFPVVLLAALVAGAGPYCYLNYLTWKRLRRFLEQMPDALDMVSQGLQAGLGLTQALVFVAKEMPDPIGTEFSVFMEELNLGLPLGDALKGFQERIPLAELRLFSVAMVVQREVGGALAELLNKLSDVIRDRFRIERQIKTLTAQNRMSAWVVCSLPPLLAVFMFSMDPVLMKEMWSDPVGRTMYLTALGFEAVGIVAFRKLIQIHI
jgi:tight adherence protein B